jgi:hypothetical protein
MIVREAVRESDQLAMITGGDQCSILMMRSSLKKREELLH